MWRSNRPVDRADSIAAPTTSTTSDREAEDTAGELDVAAAPTAAAQTEMATAESASAAARRFRRRAAVLHDADELHSTSPSRWTTSRRPTPTSSPTANVSHRQSPSMPSFEDVDGAITPVAVASTADGYAAVSLDDCTIVLRVARALADGTEGRRAVG